MLAGAGLGSGEYLLIPQLAVQERLVSGTTNRAFARRFSQALRECLEKAEIDPSGPVATGRAARFTSLPRLAAWLIGEPRSSEPYVAGLVGGLPGASTVQHWMARKLLPNAPAVTQTARLLITQGHYDRWLVSLSSSDLLAIESGLKAWFGITVTPRPSASTGLRSPNPPAASGARTAVRVEALREELIDQFARTPLSPRHKAIGAVLAYIGTFPFASRGEPLTRFLTAIVDEQGPESGVAKTGAGSAPTAVEVQGKSRTRPKARNAGMPDPNHGIAAIPPASEARGKTHTTAGEPPRLTARPGGLLPGPSASGAVIRSEPGPVSLERLDDAVTLTSQFCGVLFLANLLRYQGFVADFGMRAGRNQGLAPFELIDGVGEAWFGREYLSSPLHRWLAGNAAQRWTHRCFSHHLTEIETITPRSCLAVRDGRHVTIWHREGFPLLDRVMARGSRLAVRLARTLGPQALRDGRLRKATAEQRLAHASRARWMSALARCLEHEMRRRVTEYAITADDLRLAGEVRIVDGQVTVRFNLAELPIAVRIAGLDRDPGWIVEEGRSLAFIFT